MCTAGNQPLLSSVKSHLTEMSRSGFRTLVVAYKDLNPESFAQWAADYKAACSSMVVREKGGDTEAAVQGCRLDGAGSGALGWFRITVCNQAVWQVWQMQMSIAVV